LSDDPASDPLSDAYSDPWAHLRHATSARIALGRTGDSLPTHRVLEFALAHARARDAVHAELDIDRLIAELGIPVPLLVQSQAGTRAQYLQRPDLGRRLAPASRALLTSGSYDACVVLADGLSAQAVQQQGVALAKRVAASKVWMFAPPVIARQARVALGDEIAEALGVKLVVMLIGERPGLSSSDSLGAYLTYAPKPDHTKDAERNCVSNIRPDGLSLDEAAKRILAMIGLAKKLRCTGTLLKEDDALALPS